ncbi:MAG: aldehyde dehydrogenase family protein [Saprospiraceae bacterium]
MVSSPLFNFPSKSYSIFQPYGVVLIISPWNYPFNLAITPLIGAIAAGNTAVIKPSEYSPNTSLLIKEIIRGVFDEKYVSVELGDSKVAP